MSKARSSSRTRRSRVELQRRLASRRERRRLSIAAIAIAVTAIAIIGSAILVVGARSAVDSDPAIAGLRSFDGLEQTHVEGTVDYAMLPPVGGPHAADFANCGVYTQPIANENAVHSLEHGAVWITYAPALATGELKILQTLARDQPYVLLSPTAELQAPLTATAWGHQLTLKGSDDPRLEEFVQSFAGGPQAPEPGAPCSGGVGTPG